MELNKGLILLNEFVYYKSLDLRVKVFLHHGEFNFRYQDNGLNLM